MKTDTPSAREVIQRAEDTIRRGREQVEIFSNTWAQFEQSREHWPDATAKR